MGLPTFIGVTQAAKYLRLNPRRVRVFIAEGRLPARMFAGAYVIDGERLRQFAEKPRPTGQPRKR